MDFSLTQGYDQYQVNKIIITYWKSIFLWNPVSKANDLEPKDKNGAEINTESFWETESSHVTLFFPAEVSHSLPGPLLNLDSTVRIDRFTQIPQKAGCVFERVSNC